MKIEKKIIDCPSCQNGQKNKDSCVKYLHSGCLVQKKILSTIDAPPGVPGVSKNHIFFSQMKVFSFCAKIAPNRHKLKNPSKLKNIQKCLRKQGFFDIFSSILMVFLSLCLLGAILAQKENAFICEKKDVIFRYP